MEHVSWPDLRAELDLDPARVAVEEALIRAEIAAYEAACADPDAAADSGTAK